MKIEINIEIHTNNGCAYFHDKAHNRYGSVPIHNPNARLDVIENYVLLCLSIGKFLSTSKAEFTSFVKHNS